MKTAVDAGSFRNVHYLIMKFYRIFVLSNLMLATSATLLTVAAQVQLGMQPQWHPYLFLIFFATLFEYNLHRLITVWKHPEALASTKHSWVLRYKKAFFLLVAASVLGFLIALYYSKATVLLTLLPFALLTILYSFPVWGKKSGEYRLRQIPFLKIFLIAAVWSAVTILLPVMHVERSFSFGHLFLMLLERFLFVFAITIPFDIRDMEVDRKTGLKTLPLQLGVQRSLQLAAIALILFACLSGVHYTLLRQPWITCALLLSSAITAYTLFAEKLKSHSLYHYGLLDGMLLLQGGLVLFFYAIWH